MSDENRQGSGNFRANNGGQKRPAGGNRMSGNRTGGIPVFNISLFYTRVLLFSYHN